MALNFLRRFRQQIILGSSVTSAWLAYTLVPHTVGLSYFKNWNRFVSNQQPDFEVFDGPTLSLIEQVKADLRAQGVNETRFERCCLFRLNSLGPMYNKGTTRLRTGAIVGIPFTFDLTLPQLVPYLTKVTSSDYTKVDLNSEAGQQFIRNISLSDRAKKFAIAWQLNYVNSYYIFSKSLIGVSCLTLYFIQSKRSQLKFFKEDNIRRIYLKAQKAQLKLLKEDDIQRIYQASQKAGVPESLVTNSDLYKIVRSYNRYIQGFWVFAFVAVYHILYYTYTWQHAKSIDKKTAKLGEDYLHGGIEFYSKYLERNKAERKLMDYGEKYYKKNGDVNQGFLLSTKRPLSKAKFFLSQLLNAKS